MAGATGLGSAQARVHGIGASCPRAPAARRHGADMAPIAALAAAMLVAIAPAGTAHATATTATAGDVSTLANPCNANPPWYDVNATLGAPYSFDDGAVAVLHKQWRSSDINYAIGRSNMANTTMTMYRSDGVRCGPVTLTPQGGAYYGRVGNLVNTGHGIWVCLNWPSGGKCTAVKWE